MRPNPSSSQSKQLTPAVDKVWLYLLSGVMWSGVGIYLCGLTLDWFYQVDPIQIAIFVCLGIFLAYLIFRFGFSTFANTNIQRVDSIPKKRLCIFAFQKWTSYPLVLVMISLGIFLRKFSPIPKPWLAVLYIGIGGGLFLSSFIYYHQILNEA